MESKEAVEWFKLKKYPHIGMPLKASDRLKWIEGYVTNPQNISKHSFLPFIHRTSKVRKYRKQYSTVDGKLIDSIVEGKKINRHNGIKTREIYYASHLDSLVYSYYAESLSQKYEKKLMQNNLEDVVNAYRSIPVNRTNPDSSNKCNIDFANDIFKYILSYDSEEFVVITFDIKSFFDNLNHRLLREAWMDVLDVERLSPDHFNVFKNITRFSYVDIVDLFEEFKDQIFIQKRSKAGQLLPVKRGEISELKFMRNQEAIAFCTKEEFLKRKNRLLKNYKRKKHDDKIKDRDFGIPQGSPISSVLANIYLLKFDKKINEFISERGGIYNRYSDDMIIVCPKPLKESIIELMNSSIQDDCKLFIQESKTQIFHFKKDNNRLICGQEFNSEINWNKNLIYLGFEFDGEVVLLKSGSLSGYYRKMKRTIVRAKKQSQKRFNKNSGEIFKHRILKRFSYKGAKRRRKWLWDDRLRGFIKSEHYDWGNFLSYAYKAANIMISNKIKAQTKKHWNKLNALLK